MRGVISRIWLLIWSKDWRAYVFSRPSSYSDSTILRSSLCRLRNHPAGLVWLNPNGLEPDMHCKTCGDDSR